MAPIDRNPDSVPRQAIRQAMRTPFLGSQSADEQRHILDLTERTAESLAGWLERYPFIRTVRVWPVALSVASAAPWTSARGILAVTRLGLWIFALDDIFDEELIGESILMRHAEAYQELIRGRQPRCENDDVFASLCDIRSELEEFPLFSALHEDWSLAFCRMVEGMINEYCWRKLRRSGGLNNLPAYEEYVDNGRYSIGIPPHNWASVIVTNDPSAVEQRVYLHGMDWVAAMCVRLANDLRSSSKELGEGNVNSQMILGWKFQQQGLNSKQAQAAAEDQVKSEITSGLETLARLRAANQTATGLPETGIAEIARFCCQFYSQFDYHTLVPAQSRK